MTERPKPNVPKKETTPSLEQLHDTAAAINLQQLGNPEFTRNRRERERTLDVLFRAVARGELSPDDAAFIGGTLHAATDMETEFDRRTGLYTEKALNRRLEEELRRAAREGKSVAVAFIDLDDFGRVNKDLSQAHGDAVLEKVGEFLNRHTRKHDTKARKGGEELVMVMPDANEEDMKRRLSPLFDFMPSYINEALHDSGFSIGRQITASVGVAQVRFNHNNPSDEAIHGAAVALISVANRRMNVAKEDGKNRIYGSAEEKAFVVDVYERGREVKARSLL
jgi:diguanylate cyclase (GGDEF)-like protein